MKKRIQKEAAAFILLLFGLFLFGCNKKEKDITIYGGSLIKNNMMFTSRQDSALAYELPIISSVEITDFEVEEIHVSGVGEYDINVNSLTGGEIYNGWYYYFANLSVKVSTDEPADFSIDSMDMLINGTSINYVMEDMKFSNTKGHMGEQVIDNKSDFVYTGGTTALYQVIPSEKEDTECMSLEIQSDCVITGFEALDYLEIKNLKVLVNGKATSIADGLPVHAGDIVDFSYNLGYKSGIHDWDLLKTTKLISYTNTEGKQCVFSDAQGFMIINYVNDNFIKDYIDNAFGDK